jgi:pyruvate carboxylase
MSKPVSDVSNATVREISRYWREVAMAYLEAANKLTNPKTIVLKRDLIAYGRQIDLVKKEAKKKVEDIAGPIFSGGAA